MNTEKLINDICEWIRDFFKSTGGRVAVIGISGGKDSSVSAALCVKALGAENCLGVLMPEGVQPDIDYAYMLVEHLGIKALEVNIRNATQSVRTAIENAKLINLDLPYAETNQAKINLAPRIRMATLYAVSQRVEGRVCNTCNLSEDYVGYSTRYGDSVGDFSPLSRLTVQEVLEVGRALGLPEPLLIKPPSDGLCGKTDEDNLGFTYKVLDKYIRTGVCENEETKALIDKKHRLNLFKLELMPCFEFNPKDYE